MSQTGEQGLGRGDRGKHLSPDTAASAARGGNNNLESSPLSRSYPGAPHIPTDWGLSGSTPMSFTILGFSRNSLGSSSSIGRSWIRRSHHQNASYLPCRIWGTSLEGVCSQGCLSRPEQYGPCKITPGIHHSCHHLLARAQS